MIQFREETRIEFSLFIYSICSVSFKALTMMSDICIQLWGSSSRLYQVEEIGNYKLQSRSPSLVVQHWNLASRGGRKLGLTTGHNFSRTTYSDSHSISSSSLYSKLRQIELQESEIVDDDW